MVRILSLELSKLTKIDPNINEQFIDQLFEEVPNLGKKHDRYYIINNNLTLHSNQNPLYVQVFNLFLQNSTRYGNLLQLLKQ